MMFRPGRLAVAVGVLGALAALAPLVWTVEQQLGLGSLFELRGPAGRPRGVTVVAISGDSAEAYDLPAYLREWPRRLHAALIDALSAAGASTIVFDIAFQSPRDPAEDAELAAAIERAGNVILLEQFRASDVEFPGLDVTGRQLRQIPAAAVFKSPALGAGPFALPTFPIRTSQFWVFGAGVSDAPMLPALALQASLLDQYGAFLTLLAVDAELPTGLPRSRAAVLNAGSLETAMRAIRRLFEQDSKLAARVDARLRAADVNEDDRRALDAMLDLYSGRASRYLNFYGPSGTVETIPFHSIVSADGKTTQPPDVAGKAVFVGFSEREQSEQQDEFISVYSEPTGLSLSGVEIGATAFANLLWRESVQPLPIWLQMLLLFGWGLLTTLVLGRVRLAVAYAITPVLAGTYMVAAASLFGSLAIWIPVVVPIGLQLPVAVLGDTLHRYRTLARQRERLRQALGPYAVPAVVARLARDTTGARHASRVVYGTCLLTDVAGYTRLAERMPPNALAELMDEYFTVLGGIVSEHGGTVGDVSGDSMVGLWVSADASAATSRRAVAAAVEIDNRMRVFNRERALTALDTPIGLESGAVALSHDTAAKNWPYRPVGDIVNTAARIQGLNRVLGTRVLVSGAVHASLDESACRRLGRFRLLGKRQTLAVYEVLRRTPTGEIPATASGFAIALEAFEQGDVRGARDGFAANLSLQPEDGPSRFYVDECDRVLQAGVPEDWDGTIVMTTK